MGLCSNFKGSAVMATAFPKRTVLATPNTRVAFQTARVESTRPVLRTSPSKNVVGAPNGSYTTLPGSPRNTASRSYRSNWPSAEDLAYDAEYMKVVIDSQKYIPRYPRYIWHHYPNVYFSDGRRRWVGM